MSFGEELTIVSVVVGAVGVLINYAQLKASSPSNPPSTIIINNYVNTPNTAPAQPPTSANGNPCPEAHLGSTDGHTEEGRQAVGHLVRWKR
jgi:hypothetical protein